MHQKHQPPSPLPLSRRGLGVAAIATAIGFGASRRAMAADKVVFGWLPATDALPFYIAMEEKSFEAVGIEVEQQKFTAPNNLVDALVANKVEVGPFGTAPGIALIAESQFPGSLKLFGLSGGELNTPYVNSTLLAPTGSPIHGIADLKGKKVGIIPGIQWRTNARYIMKQNNLNPDTDLRLVELAFPLQIPALKAGTIDALITIEPFGSMAAASGGIDPIIVNLAARYVSNPFWGGCAVMTTKFIKERPEVARKVMVVLRGIVKKIQGNFDQYKPLMVKYGGVPESALPTVKQMLFQSDADLNDTDLNALQKFTDMLNREGMIGTPIDVRTKIVRLADIK